jgi:hypothetical protein
MNIEELHRVGVTLYQLDENQHPGKQVELTFIVGISPDGLSPFEMDIYGMKEGEQKNVTVPRADAPDYFANVSQAVQNIVNDVRADIPLLIHVRTVATVSAGEVVRAVAAQVGDGGCGGSCGCGC